MAETVVGTGNALTQKLQSASLFVETLEALFFDKMMGDEEDPSAIIVRKTELEREAGDSITVGFVPALVGTATIDDAVLEGEEEAINLFSDNVILQQRRHAVKLGGRMTEKRTRFNLRETARRLLTVHNGDTADNVVFDGFESSPTQQFFPGSATSTATITAADKIDFTVISRAAAFAKGTASPRIPPVTIAGTDWFVFIMHPHVAFDLKEDARYEQVQREVRMRAAEQDHPLLMGALGAWDGVLLFESSRVAIATNFGAGANLAGATNSFLGRHAGLWAWGDFPRLAEKADDFGNKYKVAVISMYGFTKTVFNASDLAYLGLPAFRTNIA